MTQALGLRGGGCRDRRNDRAFWRGYARGAYIPEYRIVSPTTHCGARVCGTRKEFSGLDVGINFGTRLLYFGAQGHISHH
jgi:hypothetical protein